MSERLDQIDRLVLECLGDEELRQCENYRDVDLFEEYALDARDAAEILVQIRRELGTYVPPSAVEPDDMNTINKIAALVERYS